VDIDQLTLDEVRQISRVIDLLGAPASIADLASCVRVLRVATYKYEQEMVKLQEGARDA